MTFNDFIRAIRRAIYGAPSDDADRKLDETNEKVKELAHAVRKIDSRVREIERAPDPWEELERTIKSDHNGSGQRR